MFTSYCFAPLPERALHFCRSLSNLGQCRISYRCSLGGTSEQSTLYEVAVAGCGVASGSTGKISKSDLYSPSAISVQHSVMNHSTGPALNSLALFLSRHSFLLSFLRKQIPSDRPSSSPPGENLYLIPNPDEPEEKRERGKVAQKGGARRHPTSHGGIGPKASQT